MRRYRHLYVVITESHSYMIRRYAYVLIEQLVGSHINSVILYVRGLVCVRFCMRVVSYVRGLVCIRFCGNVEI